MFQIKPDLIIKCPNFYLVIFFCSVTIRRRELVFKINIQKRALFIGVRNFDNYTFLETKFIHIIFFYRMKQHVEKICEEVLEKIVLITLFCLYKLHKRSTTHNRSFTYTQNKNKSFQNIHFKKLQIVSEFQSNKIFKAILQR